MLTPTQATKKPQPATPQPSRMTLASLTRGRIARPHRVLVYGTEGVGKSTFGAAFPSPIFLGAEDGTANLDVARFPQPNEWADILEAVATLHAESHEFRTLVIDSLDWAEPLCWADVCKANGKASIKDFSYGDGFTAALERWHGLLKRLEALRAAKGMHVVFLAHAHARSFKNPEGPDYDRWELKLNAKASGVVKEWCDSVLFAHFVTFTSADKDGRVRGVGDGSRVMETERRPAWDAKNRFDLPPTLPLSAKEYFAAVDAGGPRSAEQLARLVSEFESRLSPADAATLRDGLAEHATNAAKLAKILDWARSKAGLTEQANHEGKEG